MVPHKSYTGISDGPPLQTSFKTAFLSPNWATATDRVYNAVLHRVTLKCISSGQKDPPMPLKGTIRAMKLDESNENFLYKPHCLLHRDLQTEGLDFDQLDLYAPIASNEEIRMSLSVTAIEDHEEENCDINMLTSSAISTSQYGWANLPMLLTRWHFPVTTAS